MLQEAGDGEGVENGVVPDKNTMHFRDGTRRIDYILAYPHIEEGKGDQKLQKQKRFRDSLEEEGLQVELEDKKVIQLNTLRLIKKVTQISKIFTLRSDQ